MSTWSDFVGAEAEFAERVRRLFDAHKHHTMATLRRDGSPRISGTEVRFEEGELFLGMMPGALRVLDLRRDPRLALHTHTVDTPEDNPASWCGDAKISGYGIEAEDEGRTDGSHRFRVVITEVVLIKVGNPADHLTIESWHPTGGLVRRQRR